MPSVHPHTRGEYYAADDGTTSKIGSPPHAWGIRACPEGRDRRARFTPTRVGNTPPIRTFLTLQTVHPHTRGEYATVLSVRGVPFGSPPHAWGIRADSHPGDGQARFTPTRVGNTY